MDDHEITALAREYAEEIRKDILPFFPRPLPDSMEVLVKKDQEEAERLICFLLRRFCLVEKKQVIEVYKSAKYDSKMMHRERLYTMFAVASARKALLESLFPEIAREVEE